MLPRKAAGEIHWARRRGARRGSRSQGGSARAPQRSRCGGNSTWIARQSDAIVRLACRWPLREMSAINEVADAASDLLQDVFGKRQEPLPLGVWPSQAFRLRAGPSWKSFIEVSDTSRMTRARSMARTSNANVVAIPVMLAALQLSPEPRKEHPVDTQTFIARHASMGSPSFTGRPAQGGADASPAARASLSSSNRGCSGSSSRPVVRTAITLSRPNYLGLRSTRRNWPDAARPSRIPFDHYAEAQ